MNIWLMNRYYYPYMGGIESSLFYISKALSKCNCNVTILTQELNEAGEERSEYSEIQRYKYKESKFIRILFPLRILYRYVTVKHHIKHVAKECGIPDLVIARDPVMGWAYRKIAKRENMIYVPPSILAYNKVQKENTNSILHHIVMSTYLRQEQFFQEKCLKNVHHIVVFSNNVKNQILERMENIKGNVQCFYPGCDEKFFISASHYEYESNQVKFLFVGRLVEDKNILMALKALKQINRNDLSFYIVGDGMQRTMLEKYVGDNCIPNVHFCGKSNTPEEFYAKSDFLLIPSKYEAFGQVISESLSSGTPVIGFKTIPGKTLTALEELIQHNKTGFIINEYSVDGLKSAIEAAARKKENKVKYMAMRTSCYRYAKEIFNWDTFVKKCIDGMEET